MRKWFVAAVLLFSLVGIGCITVAAPPTPTPKPSPTPVPVASPTRTPTPAPTATPTPSPTPTPTPEPKEPPKVTVDLPKAGEKVSSPIRISGSAVVFEAVVSLRVKNAAGQVIGEGNALASAGAPQRGIYTAQIAFTPPAVEGPGTIEAFSRSPRDGSLENLVAVPVILMPR
ncbi:MAG: Gmad2 immunoglobulin-like domain-containing protein [Chloroflexi bacterium]|nr:Gmad2 immunoglobulin-like domain-containing protein [Chloroflexota bacterium]